MTGRGHILSAAIGALALLWCAHALTGDGAVPLVLVHALLPWWGALAFALLPIAAWMRAPAHAALAGALALLYTRAMWPGGAVAAAGPTVPLVVAEINLFEHNARPDDMLRELASLDADVLALIELDRAWWALIDEDPRFSGWPYRLVEDRTDAFGIGLLSRLPLVDGRVSTTHDVPRIDAVLTVGGGPLALSVVHVTPPYRTAWIPLWQDGLNELAAPGFPSKVVAGDLNATLFNPSLQRLIDAGWRDAADASGLRHLLTWPKAPLPLLGLDHVLVRDGIGVAAVERLEAPGSDHFGLRVTLAIPTTR